MRFRFGLGLSAAAAAAALAAFSVPALAEEGRAGPWQISMIDGVTSIAERMHQFNTFLTIIITLITLFVIVLLAICLIRYNHRANPTPSKTTHNAVLELAWTIVPVVILVIIAIPSFRLLYAEYDMPKPDITIRATGHQWYWNYEYEKTSPTSPQQAAAEIASDKNADFAFDSVMLKDNELKAGQPRLLSVDNEVVVPVGKVVRVLVTGADVIHSFAMPAFGIKADAVPGRMQEVWFNADREGTYYGQCSELCGRDHAFMPIVIRVVSQQEYQNWLPGARKRFAENVPAVPAARQLADARLVPAR
ncbi:MAG TPA: cytochrome c oxidase subunit II [Hyphomicrobiales bacterium]|nr:cytochrome c oxidase subunit II [Hyphomicrobiales bacterium]